MEYKYIGAVKVSIDGFGQVKPGETFETNLVINHPDFKLKEGHDKDIKKKSKGDKI
jgi:hypothetical protein